MKKILFIFSVCLCSLTLSINVNAKGNEQIIIPNEIGQFCEKYGEEYDVCPELLEAMCWHETRCDSDRENEGCIGLTQINPKFHQKEMELLGIDDLHDAEQNIHLCAYMLRQYFEEEDEIYRVLMIWNCGYPKGTELFSKGIVTNYALEIAEETQELEREHEHRREIYDELQRVKCW